LIKVAPLAILPFSVITPNIRMVVATLFPTSGGASRAGVYTPASATPAAYFRAEARTHFTRVKIQNNKELK
jgi:hypothetical protein